MTTEPTEEVNVSVHVVTEDEHYDALASLEDDRSRVEDAHTERTLVLPENLDDLTQGQIDEIAELTGIYL